MNFKKISLSVVTALMLSTSSAYAVEYGDEAVVIENSPAVQVENKFQESVPKTGAIRSESKDSEELAREFMDSMRGVSLGWNPKNRTIVVMETSIRNIEEDPSYNKHFMNIRNMAAIEAVLRAKTQVIKSIRSNMSAEDILVGPGSNLDDALAADLKNAKRKLEAQERKLKKLLKEENIAYDAVQEGVTFKDRANSFFDATIKKLDEQYDSKNIEAKKRKKLEKIKKYVAEANTTFEEASKKAKALEGTIRQTQTSTRKILAGMPIFGATVVEQFESYNEDKEEYKNTVIMMWSPKTEEASLAMLQGKDVVVPPGQESLKSWLISNKQALLTSTGGRRFRDDEGNVYFIGIGAQEKGGSASAQRKAMSMAKIEAQTQVGFALFADVKSQEVMESKEIVRNAGTNKDSTQSLTSMAETLSQSISDMTIQGASEVYNHSGIHPLTGNEIYISVYAISAKAAQAAMKAEASSYMTKLGYIEAQHKAKAKKHAMVDAETEKKNDPSAYVKEYNKKSKEIKQEQAKVEKKVTQRATSTKSNSSHSSSSNTATQSGGYKGVGTKDSFGW